MFPRDPGLDGWLAPFPAKLTAKTDSSGTWLYAWTEQVIDSTTGAYTNASPARSGTATNGPALELNNVSVDVTGTPVVWMRLRGYAGNAPGGQYWEFVAPDAATSGITLYATEIPDEVPIIYGTGPKGATSSLYFDEAIALWHYVSSTFARLAPAGRTWESVAGTSYRGGIDSLEQTFGGVKRFNSRLIAHGGIVYGELEAATDGEQTFSISNITNDDPGVVTTSTAHGLASGRYVWIANVGGMTEVNGRLYKIVVLLSTTFSLQNTWYDNGSTTNNDIDTTGYGSYTSGGTVTVRAIAPNVDRPVADGVWCYPDVSEPGIWKNDVYVSSALLNRFGFDPGADGTSPTLWIERPDQNGVLRRWEGITSTFPDWPDAFPDSEPKFIGGLYIAGTFTGGVSAGVTASAMSWMGF